jgi:hypothetical protein
MNLSISGDDREKLVDSSLNGYRLEIDKTGVARLVVIQAHGAASVAEKGLAMHCPRRSIGRRPFGLESLPAIRMSWSVNTSEG